MKKIRGYESKKAVLFSCRALDYNINPVKNILSFQMKLFASKLNHIVQTHLSFYGTLNIKSSYLIGVI